MTNPDMAYMPMVGRGDTSEKAQHSKELLSLQSPIPIACGQRSGGQTPACKASPAMKNFNAGPEPCGHKQL